MGKGNIVQAYSAILLAAGIGSRISNVTNDPKVLLKVGSKTILDRHLESWIDLGIKEAILVLGHQREKIQKSAEKYFSKIKFKFINNDQYINLGNTYSLFLGLKECSNNCLIFDADLVYEISILRQFMQDQTANQVLVGRGSLDDIECAKALINKEGFLKKTIDKRAVSKEELSIYQFVGEALGILKFDIQMLNPLRKTLENFLSDQSKVKLNWEHWLNEFLVNHKVGVHQTDNPNWIEIDTQKDYLNALEIFKV